ncbi:MAG: NACHT domain-containing protein [Gammaproteobacteria bacterium]|nr:NACHT domain-containing protein [Gammaproteobacteria bacterium]
MDSREATFRAIAINQIEFSKMMRQWLMKDYQVQPLVSNPIYPTMITDVERDYLPVNLTFYHNEIAKLPVLEIDKILHFPQQTSSSEQSIATQVLLFGEAGGGKSMFSQLLAKSWVSKNSGIVPSQFDWVFLLPLRKLVHYNRKQLEKLTLRDIVYEEIYRKHFSNDMKMPIEYRTWWDRLDQSKVLYLFDGFDEVLPDLVPAGLWLITQAHHYVLTSRPWTEPLLSKSLKPTASTRSKQINSRSLLLNGLNAEQVEVYIKRFSERLVQRNLSKITNQPLQLMNFLKKYPALWDIATSPRTLELICSIWYKEANAEKPFTANTITKIYEKIIDNVIGDHEKVGKIISCLESLAFNAFGNTIFTHDDISKSLANGITLEDLLSSGIFMPMDGADVSHSTEYCFVNLSIQEFFTARFLASQFDEGEKAWQQFKAHQGENKNEYVSLFLSGLMSRENQIESYLNLLMQDKSDDIIGFRLLLLLVKCLNENFDLVTTQQKDVILYELRTWIINIFGFNQQNLRVMVPECATHLINNLKKNTTVFASSIITEIFIEALHNSSLDVRLSALNVLSQTGSRNQALTDQLILLFNEEKNDEEIKILIIKALSEIPTADESIILQLISAANNEDVAVKSAALQAIVTLAITECSHALDDCLMNSLKHNDEKVHFYALQAIKNLRIKSPAMLKACCTVLQDTQYQNVVLAVHILGDFEEYAKLGLEALLSFSTLNLNKSKNNPTDMIDYEVENVQEGDDKLYKTFRSKFRQAKNIIEFLNNTLPKHEVISPHIYYVLKSALARVLSERNDMFDSVVTQISNQRQQVGCLLIDALALLIPPESYEISEASKDNIKNELIKILSNSLLHEKIKLSILNAFAGLRLDTQIINLLLGIIRTSDSLQNNAITILGQHDFAYEVAKLNYEDIDDKKLWTIALKSTSLNSLLTVYSLTPTENILKFIYHKALATNAALLCKSDKIIISDEINNTDFILTPQFNIAAFVTSMKKIGAEFGCNSSQPNECLSISEQRYRFT